MTPPESTSGAGEPGQEDLHISDKRRFDPETYERRQPQQPEPGSSAPDQPATAPGPAADAPDGPANAPDGPADTPEGPADSAEGPAAPEGAADTPEEDLVVPDDARALVAEERIADLEKQVGERTDDLKRVQAEYVNYKRRVDRDRDLARRSGIESVLFDLCAVLDDLTAARAHEELSGGVRLVAEEIEKVAGKYGLEAYGAVGDPFDPQIHEALMHQPAPEGAAEQADGPVVSAVLQSGYRVGERVLRPARVAVSGS